MSAHVALRERLRGKVDRQPHRRVLPVLFAQCLERLADHPAVDFGDQAEAFGGGQECVRRDQAAIRCAQADQDLVEHAL